MTTSPTPCRYCGTYHGVRCPSVAAIEYHPDGTVRRVEFVQPLAAVVGPGSQILPQPYPASPAVYPNWIRQTIGQPQTAQSQMPADILHQIWN